MGEIETVEAEKMGWIDLPRGTSHLTFPNIYYGFQTVCKCPFRALLVTSATDSSQTWANLV